MTDAERHAREAAPPRYDPATDLAAPEADAAGVPEGDAGGVPEPVRAKGPDPVRAAASGFPPAQPGTPPLASVIARPASSGRGTSLLMVLAGAIAIGGLAFAGGRLTAPATTTANGPGNGQGFPGNGQGFPGRGDAIGGGVTLAGTVTAVTADSITIELATGTSMTIPLNADTEYHAATTATRDEVAVGSEVTVSPGGRTANPGASFDPNASPGPGIGGFSFGAATDVTVVEP